MIPLAPESEVAPIDKTGWLMGSILNAVEEVFALYDIDLPTLKYLTFAQPSHDCEQVTVTMIQAYIGPAGEQADNPQPCTNPRTGVFQVEIVRCIDDGVQTNLRQRGGSTAPDATIISDYARDRAKDAWALLQVPQHLFDYNQAIVDVAVTEPQGKFQAVVLNIIVQI
jgi:hypothetical protein